VVRRDVPGAGERESDRKGQPSMPLALQRFRAKVPAGRTDADRAYRENENDDLVLAVGMAVLASQCGWGISDEALEMLTRPIWAMRESWKG
jgi:hypothetical protein